MAGANPDFSFDESQRVSPGARRLCSLVEFARQLDIEQLQADHPDTWSLERLKKHCKARVGATEIESLMGKLMQLTRKPSREDMQMYIRTRP